MDTLNRKFTNYFRITSKAVANPLTEENKMFCNLSHFLYLLSPLIVKFLQKWQKNLLASGSESCQFRDYEHLPDH